MDYNFERLGEDKFQEYCQALILKEFPFAQAFPTNQPDGGRDSITYFTESSKSDFFVFQVKYVRNPLSITDVHKWLSETVKKEISKIKTLIPRGATKYILITNVKGTAHLDNGSIDIVHLLLNEGLNIPATCWWRDDISRRTDNNIDLKWTYPEILDGQEILNSLLFENFTENRNKRESVIRAYLADQYSLDDKVKFRQVDLQNQLLSLFTDVPIRIKKYDEKNRVLKSKIYKLHGASRSLISFDSYEQIFQERKNYGAAEYLLSSEVQSTMPRILLEGGPGQGKSTISQYVSQIHRIHLLRKINDLEIIPESFKSISVRLPFKIDLRHMAYWVENKNPYPKKLSEIVFSKIWQKSLESFLLGHLLYHSQLDDFDRSDLVAVFKLSPILLVFDGFDEIANIKIREEVIEVINKGLDRLSENALSVQVIITSRPAAFVDSVGFAVEKYPHYELTDITPAITKEYVEKWINASKLDHREAAEIRRLVEEKLQMPHLKDLAKSPMQLAIFISLLRKKGDSLPNKRTALYDSYIELFFDRESEKSVVIRDNRDLIIDIHEYLGWILHSEAELYKSSGSIEIGALKKVLKDYLDREGHLTDIADQLFDVVKERVCALASRVQGTFEFEVQPLREYFCAKYLYKTSPYSPVGKESFGTKPDRFDAIAPNYYWQNTVRFFAGCFDKGELPMLTQQLKELQQHPDLKYTNYPRLLTSQILSDWVFKQYPKLLKDVVELIVDGFNVGNVINQNEDWQATNESILVPLECGRMEIVTECFTQLKQFPLADYANELIGVIKKNSLDIVNSWIEFALTISGHRLTRWIEFGYKMQILHKVPDEILHKLVFKEPDSVNTRLQLAINYGRHNILQIPEVKKTTFQQILRGAINITERETKNFSLKYLSNILRTYTFINIIKSENTHLSFFQMSSSRHGYQYKDFETYNKESDFEINDELDKTIVHFKESIKDIIRLEAKVWQTSIKPWETLVDNAQASFGKQWIFDVTAVIAAGVKSREERFDEYDFGNEQESLCKRVRSARMKSGNAKYWHSLFEKEDNVELKLIIFFTWATPKTFLLLKEVLQHKVLPTLSVLKQKRIESALSKLGKLSTFNQVHQEFLEKQLLETDTSDYFKFLVSYRFDHESRAKFIYLGTDDISDQKILNLKLEFLLNNYLQSPHDEIQLELIKRLYSMLTVFSNKYSFFSWSTRWENIAIPVEIARKIMQNSKSYPRLLASIAERSCRTYAFQNTVAVGEIATNCKWFNI